MKTLMIALLVSVLAGQQQPGTSANNSKAQQQTGKAGGGVTLPYDKQQPHEEPARAGQQQNETGAIAQPSISAQGFAERLWQRFKSLKSADQISAGLLLVTALYLGFTIMIWRQMVKSNKHAETARKEGAAEAEKSYALSRKQFEVYERPWVAASIAPRGSLCFDESGGAYVMLLLTLKNVGRSVATHVRFEYKLLANPLDVITEQCAIAARIHPDALGEALFPRGSNREPIYCAVSKEEIERGETIIDGDDRYVTLSIVGVVAYRFATSSDPHTTRFAYRVGRVDPRKILRGVKVGAELQAEDIHTTWKEPSGNHAD